MMNRPQNRSRLPVLATAVLSVLCAGCVAGPRFHRPHGPLPARYRPSAGPARAAAQRAPVGIARYRQRIELGARQAGPWWAAFRSAQLDQLIRQALADNHDLAADEAAVQQAREAVTVGASGRYPQVMADA